MSKAIKIVVCGPMKAGKTCIANLLAGFSDVIGYSSGQYDPTVGVRIFECERKPEMRNEKVLVELWDVSGNMSFESCWPAISIDMSGAILVYNPEIPTHELELNTWYDEFISNTNISDEKCLIIALRSDSKPIPRPRLPLKLSNVTMVSTNASGTTDVLNAFDDLLVQIQQSVRSRK